jgi:predicted Rossmann fold nucleotide-binding protein DprA/Smf involved in DNA uptake
MTLGTVVVEANLTSGALITANFPTEYDRQVFEVAIARPHTSQRATPQVPLRPAHWV